MKALALALLLCAPLSTIAQDQFFTLKFGAAYNKLDGVNADFSDAIGYYFGFGLQDRITTVLGYGFDLNYLNQRSEVEGISLSARSVNAATCIHLHASDAFYFMAGLESGMVSSIRVEDETSPGDLEYRFGYVLGMAYVLSDRWDLQGRYIGPFDHMQAGFDFNVQLGLVCKIGMNR